MKLPCLSVLARYLIESPVLSSGRLNIHHLLSSQRLGRHSTTETHSALVWPEGTCGSAFNQSTHKQTEGAGNWERAQGMPMSVLETRISMLEKSKPSGCAGSMQNIPVFFQEHTQQPIPGSRLREAPILLATPPGRVLSRGDNHRLFVCWE